MSAAVIAVIAIGVSESDSSRFLAVTMTSSSAISSSCDQAAGMWIVAAIDIATAKVSGFFVNLRMDKAPLLFSRARPDTPNRLLIISLCLLIAFVRENVKAGSAYRS